MRVVLIALELPHSVFLFRLAPPEVWKDLSVATPQSGPQSGDFDEALPEDREADLYASIELELPGYLEFVVVVIE